MSKPAGSIYPKRRRRGFEHCATLLAQRIRKAGEGRGFAVARLLTHWSDIVGEDIAQQTQPVKINHAKGGMGATLVLLTTGAYAPIVEMAIPRIRDKVNACYGYNAVSRISLTQTAPSGFAEAQMRFGAKSAQVVPPDPEKLRNAEQVAAGFTDPTLGAAMRRLTLNHLSRQDPSSNRKTNT